MAYRQTSISLMDLLLSILSDYLLCNYWGDRVGRKNKELAPLKGRGANFFPSLLPDGRDSYTVLTY